MQHRLPLAELGAFAEPMAGAIESCVHCGFCLPTCPTYGVLAEEMDSPRGRIVLMKGVLEGELGLESSLPFIDNCLGCMACVTACPSGVAYENLLIPFRMHSEAQRERSLSDRVLRSFVLETLPYPGRFRLAAKLARFGRAVRPLMPKRLKTMLDLLPERLPKAAPLPDLYPAEGQRRARVALLAGCAQQVLAPDINWATLRVLARNGVEVVIPKRQSCCGALAAHTGLAKQAKAFAKNNLQAFPKDVDAVLTNAAGCGSGMHEYPLWLRGEPEQAEAEAFSHRVKDVSVFLAELGLESPPVLTKPLKVAYHDACHLAHAQGVTEEPRQVLDSIAGLERVELNDAEICCGSAGTYNIERPDIAAELGERKAESVRQSGAKLVVTGNIGCMQQLKTHLQLKNESLPVFHTVQLLDAAYRGEM